MTHLKYLHLSVILLQSLVVLCLLVLTRSWHSQIERLETAKQQTHNKCCAICKYPNFLDVNVDKNNLSILIKKMACCNTNFNVWKFED